MYGALGAPTICEAALFSMTIHTTCSHVGAPAATPQGFAAVGATPAGGVGSPPPGPLGPAGGGTTAACPLPGACPAAPLERTARCGARAPPSRLVSTMRCLPFVASDSATTPLELTRCVTSMDFHLCARSGPVLTTRGPVFGAFFSVIARSFHGRSDAWRRRIPRLEAVSENRRRTTWLPAGGAPSSWKRMNACCSGFLETTSCLAAPKLWRGAWALTYRSADGLAVVVAAWAAVTGRTADAAAARASHRPRGRRRRI